MNLTPGRVVRAGHINLGVISILTYGREVVKVLRLNEIPLHIKKKKKRESRLEFEVT